MIFALCFGTSIFLSFSTPVAGGFRDTAMLMMLGVSKQTPVAVTLGNRISDSSSISTYSSKDRFDAERILHVPNSFALQSGMTVVGECSFTPSDSSYTLMNVQRVNPAMIFPLIQGLGELGRNILFHVPMSFIAFIAFLVGTFYSILFLRKGNLKYDLHARAASSLGLMFTTLATVTGSIWARFSWGKFWDWDEPRETSILVLLLIYIAYFLLRSLLEDTEEKKARLAAVYNIIAFATVPFLMFVLPRITRSLHPGSGSEAPVINLSGKTHIDPSFSLFLWINVACFAILFFIIKDLYIRIETIRQQREPNYD